MRPVLWLALGLLVAPPMAGAQSQVAQPVYHGILSVSRARGTIDRDNGNAMVKVPAWTALLTPDTNGIFPDQEPLVISVDSQDFTLPAGMLKVSPSGKKFSYRGPRNLTLGVRDFRMKLRRDGSYVLRFTLAGVELSRLKFEDPICLPLAIIVGDDDFFNGVSFSSPSFASRRLLLPSSCDVSGDWPWIRG